VSERAAFVREEGCMALSVAMYAEALDMIESAQRVVDAEYAERIREHRVEVMAEVCTLAHEFIYSG
jgi:hypothetical protein